MTQQHTTTSGTGSSPQRGAGKEIKPDPGAAVKKLGSNRVETQENGVTVVGTQRPDGRIFRDS